MYENYRKLGPYTRKDNRKIILVKINENWQTVSYPKYLMEEHLGRFLNKNETVDHINANFTDDRIENLQILSRAENSAKSFKDGTAHSGPLNLSKEQRNARSNKVKGNKNPASKFTKELVIELRTLYKNKQISIKEIMEKYQTSEKTTRSMLKGKTYSNVLEELPIIKSRETKIKEVKTLQIEGYSLRQIAKITKIGLTTVQVYLKSSAERRVSSSLTSPTKIMNLRF